MKIIDKIINFLTKILIFIIIVGVVFVGISYMGSSISESWDRYQYKKDFQENYYDSPEFENAQEEGLKSYGYTDEEIETFTNQEKTFKATQKATMLKVYDVTYDVKTDTNLNHLCLDNIQLQYNDNFDMFQVNPKWEKFYGLASIFGDDIIEVNYKSNMYLTSDKSFPLQYKEDYKVNSLEVEQPKYSQYDVDLSLNDYMQVVLLDSNNDDIPNDTNLLLKVNVDVKNTNTAETEERIEEIPLKLRNGVLSVDSMRYECD